MKAYQLRNIIYAFLLITSQAHSFDVDGGEIIGRHIYGLAIDHQGDPLLIEDRPLIYAKSDVNEFINIEKNEFVISSFSHQIGGVYITRIDPKSKNSLDTVALNLASVGGFSDPVGGIKTAWNSLMLTERQLIDARAPKEFIVAYQPYFKEKSSLVHPYQYGWISEVVLLDANGQAKAIKNYAVGRLFATQVLMMPDGKTFYMLDSKNSGNLYLFIAEHPNSLTKGTLYAVSRQQNQVKYTPLGNASALKMKFKLKGMTFDSLFESTQPDNRSCTGTFQYIKTVYGEECLKLKSDHETVAGLFEPIRVMAMKGIPEFGAEITNMKFDASRQEIRFESASQNETVFPVGHDPKLDSQFIIQVSR